MLGILDVRESGLGVEEGDISCLRTNTPINKYTEGRSFWSLASRDNGAQGTKSAGPAASRLGVPLVNRHLRSHRLALGRGTSSELLR